MSKDFLSSFEDTKNECLKTDQQLKAADFPNATTLYGWNMDSGTDTAATGAYAGTKFGTEKDLTLKAQKLTASNDVLGTSRYNTIIAGGYFQSTDAVFDVANTADTDDFMVGGWVYFPSITPVQYMIFSNRGAATNGWWVYLNASGELRSGFDLAVDINMPFYRIRTIGWYHIVFAREVGVALKLYVNGVLCNAIADANIGTTQGYFQLGGYTGANATPEAGVRYDECFFKKGVLPTNIDDVVRQLYARSAKKFAVKDANGSVNIAGTAGVALQTSLETTFNNGDADIADTSRLSFVVPEAGLYYLQGQATVNGANVSSYIRIKVGSATYANALGVAGGYQAQTGSYATPNCSAIAFIAAGETVHLGLYVAGTAGTNREIFGDSWQVDLQNITSLKAIKIG
jgi:hypothetical protein